MNIATNSDVNAVSQRANKNKERIEKLKTSDLSYFLGFWFLVLAFDGFQNMFFYQATLCTLELKQDKDTEFVIGWKSRGIHTSKLIPLYTAFLYNIERSGYFSIFHNSVRVF